MKTKLLVLSMFLLLVVSSHAVAPTVTDVTAQQRQGTKLVDIQYNLVLDGNKTAFVELWFSDDGGATYNTPCMDVTGDVEANITSGSKNATWNAESDWNDKITSDAKIRVIANYGDSPSGFNGGGGGSGGGPDSATIYNYAPSAPKGFSTPASVVNVTEDILTDTTWTRDNNYILKDYIFVASGATLSIEAGTIIKADQGTGDAAPALIITQNSRIHADGNISNPIIFTSFLDNGSNLTKNNKGLWGGLIILGKAPINSNGGSNPDNSPLTSTIEGIPTTSGISGRTFPAAYSQYGGADDLDDSGFLRFVSIRHGGANIGAGNEINGLTLAGVGEQTQIDHVEIFASRDDGIEFFGGSVDAKHLSVAYAGDDSFDFDEGYNGRLQYLLSIQDENSNRAIEWDGSTESDDKAADTSTLPDWSEPLISNMTAIGIGKNSTSTHEDNNIGLEIRDNAAGRVMNSVFTEFAKSIMDVEKTDNYKGTQSETDSYVYGSQALMQNGKLVFNHNLFYNGGHSDGNTASGTAEGDSITASELADSVRLNSFDVNPMLQMNGSTLTPFPAVGSPVFDDVISDSDFENTHYRGAFSGYDSWIQGWTRLDQIGFHAGTWGDN